MTTTTDTPSDQATVSGVCSGCGQSIQESHFLETTDKKWHPDCLKCSSCKETLGGTFFEKDGKAYCQLHYTELYLSKCAGCGKPNTSQVMNAKDRLYHPECFKCSKCDRVIRSGEKFAMRGPDLYCMDDYEHAVNKFLEGKREEEMKNKIGDTPNSPMADADKMNKRQRTIISEEQSQALKRYFEHNQTPDTAQRTQLAKDLGLPQRVVQVWFQNKRASKRKQMEKTTTPTQQISSPNMSPSLNRITSYSPQSMPRPIMMMGSADRLPSPLIPMTPNMPFPPHSPSAYPLHSMSMSSLGHQGMGYMGMGSQTDMELVNQMASVQLLQTNSYGQLGGHNVEQPYGANYGGGLRGAFSTPNLPGMANSSTLLYSHQQDQTLSASSSPDNTPASMLLDSRNGDMPAVGSTLSNEEMLGLSSDMFDNPLLSGLDLTSLENDASLAQLLDEVVNTPTLSTQQFETMATPPVPIKREPQMLSRTLSTCSLPEQLFGSFDDISGFVHRPKALLAQARPRTPYQRDVEMTPGTPSPAMARKKLSGMPSAGLPMMSDNNYGYTKMDYSMGF